MSTMRRLRNASAALIRTPLHPQWLMARQMRSRIPWVAARARGLVLDIGCADRSLAEALPRATAYVGLDYPATAKGLYRTSPDVFGDAAALPIRNSTIDCVLLLDVLEHLPEPERSLEEITRVLKPGGRVLILMPFAYPVHDAPFDFQRYTRFGLQRRLHRAGLRVLSIEERGSAIEAGALMLCLGMAWAATNASLRRPWTLLVAALLAACVPVVNLFGWMLASVSGSAGFLPMAHWVEAEAEGGMTGTTQARLPGDAAS